MVGPTPFPVTVLRSPSPAATCSCEHWLDCDCACHGRHCDTTEDSYSVELRIPPGFPAVTSNFSHDASERK